MQADDTTDLMPGVPEIRAVEITTPDGMTLAADIAGAPWQPRLLFVHGGAQSRRSWRGALQAMAGSGFSVVSYDLRGHGESDWSRDGDYDLDAHVRDLVAVVNAAPNPPAIVGASLGGQVALEAAAQLGDRVRALVLVDAAPQLAAGGLARINRFFEESRDGFDTIEDAAAALERYAERKIDGSYIRLTHAIRTDDDGRIFWSWDPRLAHPGQADVEQTERRLTDAARRLTCPTLLVRGTQSDIVTDDSVAHLKATNPTVKIIDIEGAGHLLKSRKVSTFCELTLEFLITELQPKGSAQTQQK